MIPPAVKLADLFLMLLEKVTTELDLDELKGEVHEFAGKHPDRVERESLEFHQRVADEYARIAKAEPQRYTVVDGTRSQAQVHAAVMERVERALAGSAAS